MKTTVSALSPLAQEMADVQSGKIAPGRVWIVKRRPDGTVERRQVDAKAFQRERAKATVAANTALPARRKMGVSQDRFAELLRLSPATVRNWEQGRGKPTGALLKLLEIAELLPELFTDETPAAARGKKKPSPATVKAVMDELTSPGKVKPGKSRILAMKAKNAPIRSKAIAAFSRARQAHRLNEADQS